MASALCEGTGTGISPVEICLSSPPWHRGLTFEPAVFNLTPPQPNLALLLLGLGTRFLLSALRMWLLLPAKSNSGARVRGYSVASWLPWEVINALIPPLSAVSEWPAQGHPAGMWEGWDLNPGCEQ